MIKHIVMWKLKDFAEGNSKLENAKLLKTSLEDLKNKIDLIKYIEVGININQSAQAYDAVLYSEFSSMEDLNTYQKHPDHLKVSDFCKKIRESRVVTDYEV